MESPIKLLSRGQIYKANLVGFLAVDPELWLIDEPFASGMDPQGLNAFKKHIRDAVERGKTVIYTTQLLEIAERFADRLCIISQGRIHAFDRVETVSSQGDGTRAGAMRTLPTAGDASVTPHDAALERRLRQRVREEGLRFRGVGETVSADSEDESLAACWEGYRICNWCPISNGRAVLSGQFQRLLPWHGSIPT